MTSNTIKLPEGYKEIKSIDLQKDKKLSLFISIFSLVLAVITILSGMIFVPFTHFIFVDANSSMADVLRPLIVIPFIIIYVILHEAIHGIFFKVFGKGKLRFGLTLMYAYAGSEGFYNKKSYTIISLAPVVILGIIIGIITMHSTDKWFWFIYLVQVANISGAAGDLYVTSLMRKLPEDILIHDDGVSMQMYSISAEI